MFRRGECLGKVLRKKGRFPEGSIVFEVETYSCVCVGGGEACAENDMHTEMQCSVGEREVYGVLRRCEGVCAWVGCWGQ